MFKAMKTGHKNKVAALDKVLGVCNALGPSYAPSRASLMPTAMEALLQLAQEKQKVVTVTRTAYALAVNDRIEAFARIPKLAAQVSRIACASGLSPEDRREVKMIQSKFYPKGKKTATSGTVPGDDNSTQQASRSTSSQDMLSVIERFEALIQLVEGLPGYAPTEVEFTVNGLKACLADLRYKNKAVSTAAIALSNARIARDQVLEGLDGVIQTTRDAVNYIRGKFGVRSLESEKLTVLMNKS
jgi:hypothetical protein